MVPSGDSAGVVTVPSFQAPPPDVRAAQSVRSARRIGGRVRDPAVAIRCRAAHEHYDRAVVGHADFAELDTIIFVTLVRRTA